MGWFSNLVSAPLRAVAAVVDFYDGKPNQPQRRGIRR